MTDYPIAVLISGGGSTLRNLLERSADGRLQARVCGVIASRDCPGLAHAAAFGVPAVVVPRLPANADAGTLFDAAEFSARLTSQLDQWEPRLAVLGGFLSLYWPAAHYIGRVINVHPALLPLFGGRGMYGARVHTAVIASGAHVSGCTVHLVDERYDHGAILAQRVVPVLGDDNAQSLADRVLGAERELYPEVINWFASGRLTQSVSGQWQLAGRTLLPESSQ